MKNFFISFFLGLLLLVSCQKETWEDDDYSKHPVLWTKYLSGYEPSGKYSLPLVDENENTYLILPANAAYGETELTIITSFDKFGNIRWEETFEGRHRGTINLQDNKLYFLLSLSPAKDNQTILYSIDNKNGEVVLTKELDIFLSDDILFRCTQDRLYISYKNMLYVYDTQGVERWELFSESYISEMVSESEFLVILDYQKIRMYKQDELLWEWQAENQSHLLDVKIGGDSLLYVRGAGVMNMLSFEGELIKAFPFEIDMLFSYKISGDNIVAGGTKMVKFDKNGIILWQKEVLKNESAGRLYDFTIASNGNIYIGHNLGLTAISPQGEQLWYVGYQHSIVQLMQPVLTSCGDLICFSPKNKSLLCIKGDGSPPL